MHAVETKKLAGGFARLNDSVGKQQHAVARMHEEADLFIADFWQDAQRQASGQCDLLAVQVGRQMAGVGRHQFTICAEPHGLAGGKALAAR